MSQKKSKMSLSDTNPRRWNNEARPRPLSPAEVQAAIGEPGPFYTVTVTVKEPHTNVIARLDIELPRDEALELLEQCNDAFKAAEDVG